jgi:hypothetical protein
MNLFSCFHRHRHRQPVLWIRYKRGQHARNYIVNKTDGKDWNLVPKNSHSSPERLISRPLAAAILPPSPPNIGHAPAGTEVNYL